jgi:hypothetical protein
MASEKIPVDQEFIKKLLASKMTPYFIHKKYDIPLSVLNDIKAGKERKWFKRKIYEGIDKKDICECCGVRKKEEGFRKLCFQCWQKGGKVRDEHLVRIYR